jgi:sterol desaturase/sphingolipid hydroxylase (fatty acid hydroxylase superfamily)
MASNALGYLLEIERVGAAFLVAAAIFAPLERLFPVQRQKLFRRQATLDVGYYVLNFLTPAIVLSAPLALVFWGAHQLLPRGFYGAVASLPLWSGTILTLVIADVGGYWGHGLVHEVPFLWRFHAIHHSSEEMDFLATNRAHPIDLAIVRLCTVSPLVAFGLLGAASASQNLVVVLALIVRNYWNHVIHANLRWRFGKLGWLIAGPAFHHWHHSRTGVVNHNYATMLPWVDWIFGTHHMPSEWPEAYGIETKLPETLQGQLIHPLLPETARLGVTDASATNRQAATTPSH